MTAVLLHLYANELPIIEIEWNNWANDEPRHTTQLKKTLSRGFELNYI